MQHGHGALIISCAQLNITAITLLCRAHHTGATAACDAQRALSASAGFTAHVPLARAAPTAAAVASTISTCSHGLWLW
jgi:porphobilinogen deaminase